MYWNNQADKLAKHCATIGTPSHRQHHCTKAKIEKINITAPKEILSKKNMTLSIPLPSTTIITKLYSYYYY
jgi:hypothetical protein